MLPISGIFKRGEDCKGQRLADLRSPCNTRCAIPLFVLKLKEICWWTGDYWSVLWSKI